MRVFKRGQTYWCEFEIDKKRFQYSCKTKDKAIAEDIASAMHADMIRNRFNIPPKNTVQRLFVETYQEYLKNISNSREWILKKKVTCPRHFLPIFANKEIKEISRIDIKNYQIKI